MRVHYLEIVTPDVDALCALYEATHGVTFSPPIPELGDRRTTPRPGGGILGIRAPMHEQEAPVVRPYVLVGDIHAAAQAAIAAGGELAHEPMEISGHGWFAIYLVGGIQHGLWQL